MILLLLVLVLVLVLLPKDPREPDTSCLTKETSYGMFVRVLFLVMVSRAWMWRLTTRGIHGPYGNTLRASPPLSQVLCCGLLGGLMLALQHLCASTAGKAPAPEVIDGGERVRLAK